MPSRVLDAVHRAIAPAPARELIARARSEVGDAALRVDLIGLIETVIVYKLPRLSREEVQAMLKIHDIRESRFYQDAKEDGVKEGMEKGMEKGIAMIVAKLAAKKMSAAEIASLLEMDVERVQKALADAAPN